MLHLLYVIFQIFYMAILSSNYTRIKISKELTDYRNAVDMEEIDLHSNGRGILDHSYDKSSFRWELNIQNTEFLYNEKIHSYENFIPCKGDRLFYMFILVNAIFLRNILWRFYFVGNVLHTVSILHRCTWMWIFELL